MIKSIILALSTSGKRVVDQFRGIFEERISPGVDDSGWKFPAGLVMMFQKAMT